MIDILYELNHLLGFSIGFCQNNYVVDETKNIRRVCLRYYFSGNIR